MNKVSPLLAEMFKRENVEEAIQHCVDKGMNKGELRNLKNSDKLLELYFDIVQGNKTFKPSHQASIPKGDGTDRIVYVGDTCERFLCSLINNALFKTCGKLIHPANKAYTKGLGTGSSVQEFSKKWADNYGKYYVVKGDFHHYFDDISKEKVYWLIDKIEKHLGFEQGTEPVCNLMRQMYDNDFLFDTEMNLIEKWSGIRQGNAIASFMANAMLYELDDYMTKKYPYYVRYSDDSITLCENPDEVKADMNRIIAKYGITMNEKKFEIVTDSFIKFLGFNVNGNQITLSASRTKDLVNEIYNGIKNCHSATQAINKINKILYKGNGEYSWGTSCLPIINVKRDISTLNSFFMDCIRIASINSNKKRKIKMKEIGGIGIEMNHSDYTMIRGKGSRVGTAMSRTDKNIDGYLSLNCMIKNINTSRALYNTLVMSM